MLEECRDLYTTRLQPLKGPPIGCPEDEVERLEAAFGRGFPAAFREYLLWLGAHHDGPFVGSEWFARDLLSNTRYLPELLAENHLQWELPAEMVCFFSHQGYLCAWFDLADERDDPLCWYYGEGTTPAPKMVGQFSALLLDELRGVAEIYNLSRTPLS